MDTEPLIRWPRPIFEYLEFVAAFLAAGAVGFHFVALRPWRSLPYPEVRALVINVERRAAVLGLVGALVGAALVIRQLAELAARRHVTLLEAMNRNGSTRVRVAMALAVIVGFAFAGRSWGWRLAAVGLLIGALRSGIFGEWGGVVNPVHMLAGGLWIGTLAIMVIVAFPVVLRGPWTPERRASLIASMVGAFSPFALVAAGFLGAFGLLTAWGHLHTLSALWTTPYGNALIVKLCVVVVVVGLGAWNWRRQRPRLDSEAGAIAISRSARAEVMVAALVLAITAILVSLPDPPEPPG